MNPLDRLKILINSSTPIVVMETVEEVRALSLVHTACSDLSLALFEWTIADGLGRSGGDAAVSQPRAVMSHAVNAAAPNTAMYNTADPVQALSNLETMTIEAVFVLKDFHRHMDNPVVVRRLRDVARNFPQTGGRWCSPPPPSRCLPSWSAWWNFWICRCPTATACAKSFAKRTRAWPVPIP